MRNGYSNILRELICALTGLISMDHLLLLCLLYLLDFLLHLWVDFKEAVPVEAADSLVDIESAVPKHL